VQAPATETCLGGHRAERRVALRGCGITWVQTSLLETLSSSSTWSFPPDLILHPRSLDCVSSAQGGSPWVAIEAGALVSTIDGGRTWSDRVSGGPWDTHELAIHSKAPDTLRVAAGDGYFESDDAVPRGARPASASTLVTSVAWRSIPSKAEVVVISASSGPHSAYVAGRSDGRLYRRLTSEPWERVREGWPEPASTIAPLLCAGVKGGELWAADERGVHRSDDGGISWRHAGRLHDVPTASARPGANALTVDESGIESAWIGHSHVGWGICQPLGQARSCWPPSRGFFEYSL